MPNPPGDGDVAIRTTALTKFYGDARGIVDVDLAVRRGEVFGFVGPNGAGKSTTMRILLDFQRATSGTAEILGLRSRKQSREIRRRSGYLSGDIALYERLTAREHLRWQNRLRRGAMTDVEPLAERLGLDLDRPIADLSKGNRQKVGLVQAFAHRPELLVLDEPTSGLDPLVQQTFHQLLTEVRDDGRTVFLSSHVISEIEQTCDRVGVIREGRLIAVEDVETLRRRSLQRVAVTFGEPVGDRFTDALRALDGVQRLTVDGLVVELSLAGGPDPLIKLLAQREVIDIEMQRLDLETSLLAFYDDESTAGVGRDDAPA